jgi:hypothetical protein
MNQRELLRLSLKGLLAWLVLSGFFWYFGAWLLTALFPLIKAVLIFLAPDLSASLTLITSPQTQNIPTLELSAWTLQPIYLNTAHFITPGTELKASANLLHIMVPLVIEGTILLVWPLQRSSQRLLLIALGFLAALLVILAVLPAQLIGKLEIAFHEVAAKGQNPRPIPWFVDWMIFCEMGGRWLLAISGAWLSIQLQSKMLPKSSKQNK